VIRFNGHRIYSYEQILSCFSDLSLHEFTLIPESFADGPPVRGAAKELVDREHYACGCFCLRERHDHNCLSEADCGLAELMCFSYQLRPR